MASSVAVLISIAFVVQLLAIRPAQCQQGGGAFPTAGLGSNFFSVLNQLKNLNNLGAQNPDPGTQSSGSSGFGVVPSPLQPQSPSAALLSALAQNQNAGSLSGVFNQQPSFQGNQLNPPQPTASPFDNIPGFNNDNSNSNQQDVSVTDNSGDSAKPFFYARCRDCNIALGEKEIMNFLQDIIEMMSQPGQNYFSSSLGKRAFDGECVNCNLLLGGQEALTAAANSMFSSMKTPKSRHFK